MTYTITKDNEVLQSGETETVVVAQDTGGTSDAISIAIDYTGYFARIATALETIAEQITPVVTESQGNVLADQISKIRAQLTPVSEEAQGETFADQIARLRFLGDPGRDDDSSNVKGTGISVINPYGYIGNAILYQLYVKQAQILDEENASPEQQLEALNKLKLLVSELFSNLDPGIG